MKLSTLVCRELWARPTALLTAAVAIVLSVAALIAIRHITTFSEHAVAGQLEQLGANILILPQESTLQNYYAADLTERTLPESHVFTILLEGLPGVEQLSPRLCVTTEVEDREVTLTGILPQSEFEASAAWQSVGMFNDEPKGCGRASCGAKQLDQSKEALTSQRAIAELADDEVVLGSDVGEITGLVAGQRIKLHGELFNISAVLPSTGTVDDSRVYAHLHTVQRLTNAGEVVNAIEVIGCCDDAATDLVPKLSSLLPDAKVVTISQIVATQVGVNRLLQQISVVVFVVLVVMGGATVAGTTSANVRERRREVGTLMAIGATPRLVTWVFLLKALWLGIGGALIGAILGVLTAVIFGGYWAGLAITPLPGLIAGGVAAAIVVTACAAYLPARHAAKLDPCICFQEV